MEASQNYSVYIHINKINGKKYVGLTKQTVLNRWGEKGINYKNSSPRFYSAIVKYGWENFDHKVVKCGLTRDEACDLEKELISEYKTQEKDFGYNIMEGGSAPSMPEHIKTILSEKLRGNKNGLGKICSEEKKRKISEAQKGRKLTEEHKAKLSKAKKGGTHKPISKEARLKIAEKHKKNMVFCPELNKVFPSIQECARQTGAYATNICKCCKGKIKTTKNLHFQYYNDVI